MPPQSRGWLATAWDPTARYLTEPIRHRDRAEKEREERASPHSRRKAALEREQGRTNDPGGLRGVVVKVVGTIAAGIGVAGAVTVVGAGIFWVRFDAIDLPATQAVSMVPRQELLVQGAQEVTIFLLVAVGAVLLIALADPKGIVTRGTGIVLGVLVLGVGLYTTCWTDLSGKLVLALIGLTVFLALLCVGIAFRTGQRQLPLLVSVFLAALLFSGCCAAAIVHDQEYAQAIAIRFGGGEPAPSGTPKPNGLTGIYVAVTDDTIYFARSGDDRDLPKRPGGGRFDTTGLYEVPLTDATTYAIGPLLPTDSDGQDLVERSAEALLKRLDLDAKSFPAAPAEDDDDPES